MPVELSPDASLVALIVAMFDAAPGHQGLTELRAVLESGESLESLARNLVKTEVFRSLYADTLSRQEFAEQFSARILEDFAGLAQHEYARQELTRLQDSGMDRAQVIGFAVTALLAVDPAHAEWGCARRAFDNKMLVPAHYSIERGKSAQTLEQLQAPISQVGSSKHSTESAIRVIDGLSPLAPRHIIGLADTLLRENTAFTATASASDTADVVWWELGGEDALQFRLDPLTGLLYLGARDFEAPGDRDGDNRYQVQVRMLDHCGEVASQTLTVTILDVAEALRLTVSVTENSPFNATLAVVPTSAAARWSLEGEDAAWFSIDPQSGALAMMPRNFEAPVDADGDNIYAVTVRATDAQGSSVTQFVAVSVTDGNEAPTAIALSSVHFDEYIAAGTAVAGLFTSDPDARDSFSYSLVPGAGATDNTAFAISGSHLIIKASPDFVTQSVYSIRVRSTDQGGLSTEQAFSLRVNDLNNAARISGTLSASVQEDAPTTAEGKLEVSGKLEVLDPDSGESAFRIHTATPGTYGHLSLSAEGNWRYSVSNSLPAIQQLGTGQTLSERFTLVSLDGSASEAFTVTIQGSNDPATIGGTHSSSVQEDVGVTSSGYLVTDGRLSITDVDAGQDALRTQTATAATYGRFSLASNGHWTYSVSNDLPAVQQLRQGQSLIEHFDGESLDGTASQRVSVTIQGANDAPTAMIVAASRLDDTISAGSAVASMSTRDADLGDTFTYSLVAGEGDTDNATFAISGNQLVINAAPDFETQPGYSLRLRSTDQGGLSVEQRVSLSVQDRLSPPTHLALDAADDSGTDNTDGLTRHTSGLTISGRAEAGATVVLFAGEDGGATRLGSTRADARSGLFSLNVSLAPGSHRLSAREADAAGNTSAASDALLLQIDDRAPSLSLDAVGMDDAINVELAIDMEEGFFEITGETEEDATVQLQLGAAGTRAVANESGFWRYTLRPADLAAMGQGELTIRVTATDAAGNEGSATRTLRIDTLPPSAPTGLALATADDSGRFNDDSITRLTEALTLTVNAEAGARVELFLDEAFEGAMSEGPAGRYRLDLDLPQGEYEITARATDAAGNRGEFSTTLALQVDVSPPPAPALDPIATDNVLDATEQRSVLTGTTDANATVTLGLGRDHSRTLTADGDGAWTYPLQADDVAALVEAAVPTDGIRGQGRVTITTSATDLAGNDSASSSTPLTLRDVHINTVTPVIFVVAENDWINATEQASVIRGAAEAHASLLLTLGRIEVAGAWQDNVRSLVAGDDGQWAYPLQSADILAIAEGEETISIRSAGTSGTGSATRYLRIDTQAPDAPGMDTVAGNNIVNASETHATLGGMADTGTTVTLTLGSATRQVTAVADRWHYALTNDDISAMGQGPLDITALATDRAGNIGLLSTQRITIDTLAPAAPTGLRLATADDSGRDSDDGITKHTAALTISGRAEAFATVTVFAGGSQIAAKTADGTGTFSTDVALGQGVYAITATATDAAGNTGPASAAMRLEVDTTPPAAPTDLLLDAEDQGNGTTAFNISGKAEAGATVELFVGEGAAATRVGSTTADARTGVFSLAVTQSSGPLTFSAQASDIADNTGESSAVAYRPVTLSVPSAPRETIDENTALEDDAAIVLSAPTLEVPEGGAALGSVSWSLQPVGDTDDTHRFVVNATTGEVRLKPQDREDQDPSADDHYSVRLMAADTARPAQMVGRTLTVEVTNVWEERWLEVVQEPADDLPLGVEIELDEGASVTMPLRVIGDPQGKLSWQLVDVRTWNSMSPVSFDESTGLLTVTAPSFEESAAWVPSSGLEGGLMAAAYYFVSDSEEAGPNFGLYVVGIRIRDVDEHRDLAISHLQPVYTVQEANRSDRQPVLRFPTSQGVDVADGLAPIGTLTWRVSQHSEALEVITTQDELAVYTKIGLDREAWLDADGHSTLTATVRAEDEDGNFAEYVVTVDVEDQPEPTRLEIGLPAALQGPGPHAVDEDIAHVFALSAGVAAGHPALQGRAIWSLSAIAGRSIEGFSIDENGRLTLASQDYESFSAGDTTRSVRVTLSDQDGTPNTVSADIVLSILDRPETGRGLALPALAQDPALPVMAADLPLPGPWDYGLYL